MELNVKVIPNTI